MSKIPTVKDINYLYPDGENQLEDFPEKDNFFIPENEYAMAWNKRNKDTKPFVHGTDYQ